MACGYAGSSRETALPVARRVIPTADIAPRTTPSPGAVPHARVVGLLPLLALLTAAHLLVDTVACVVAPLWPDLERRLGRDSGWVMGLFVVYSVSSSVTQLAFGYWGDRVRRGWVIWIGPAVAIMCFAAIGLATSPWALAALLAVGGLGVAAFHPEAAALAGQSLPARRSRAMSIFAVGGYLGQAAGPWYGGWLADSFGLPALWWGGLICLPLWGLATLVGRRLQVAETTERSALLVTVKRSHGRWPPMLLVLAIGSLRVMPALGVPLALAFLLDARDVPTDTVGLLQATFMAGIGAGNLACAVAIGPALERRVLWLAPLAAIVPVAAIPWLPATALWLAAPFAGALLGVAMPVLIGFGQQLWPHAPRLASSITMGVSWGLGGALVGGLFSVLKMQGMVEWAFPAYATALVFSIALCPLLPRWVGSPSRARH
jgi:FSR family fosmidomycin resistance protein-like MFS transporter